MVAINRDDRHELFDRAPESSAIAGILHGFAFAVPLWTLIASVVIVVVVR